MKRTSVTLTTHTPIYAYIQTTVTSERKIMNNYKLVAIAYIQIYVRMRSSNRH